MPVLARTRLLQGKNRPANFWNKTSIGKASAVYVEGNRGIKACDHRVTTPGMAFWFRPEFARGIDFQYPANPFARDRERKE